MHSLLKTVSMEPLRCIPSADPGLSDEPVELLSPELYQRLITMHRDSHDRQYGALNLPIKFIDRDSTEYSLVQAAHGNRDEKRMARLTLMNALALIDPVWGGIYQYSTGKHWDRPHYVRTMAGQAGCLRIYALAFALFGEIKFLEACNRICDYLEHTLLGEDGAFYSGQSDSVAGIDANLYFALDDAGRRQYGIPAVHRSTTAQENGWAIEALAACYEFCGNKRALMLAERAARWLDHHCQRNHGVYSRHPPGQPGLHLADTLAAGRALLQLYRTTGTQNYLDLAMSCADAISNVFPHPSAGFNPSTGIPGYNSNLPQIDENISTTRFLNLIWHYGGHLQHRQAAWHGFRWLSLPQVATARIEEAGILLAHHELQTRPATVSIRMKATPSTTPRRYPHGLRQHGWYKIVSRDVAGCSDKVPSRTQLPHFHS